MAVIDHGCVCVCVCVYREAWRVCGNMNKEIAMQLYVEELTEVSCKYHDIIAYHDIIVYRSDFPPS